ncbi:MAG: hypothetical protein IPP45_19590 [Sphingomonadales bacterium]|nr:hypothetical protein [Sphingomonadales bacterium]
MGRTHRERNDISYFRGQIGFLLRFSGIDLNNADEEIARVGWIKPKS